MHDSSSSSDNSFYQRVPTRKLRAFPHQPSEIDRLRSTRASNSVIQAACLLQSGWQAWLQPEALFQSALIGAASST